jgi:hypothetical protein
VVDAVLTTFLDQFLRSSSKIYMVGRKNRVTRVEKAKPPAMDRAMGK